LRDAILHVLEDDPTLEPRDVIVMCPDIETFAPLIQATFGAGEVAAEDEETLPARAQRPDLRVRLADRSLRQTNPVLGVVARLIELGTERVTASQVLDLVDRGPAARSCVPNTCPRPWDGGTRGAAASASTTTTSRASRSGSRTAGSAGGST